MRCFWNIVTDKLEATAAFYVEGFGFSVAFESDWFILLTHDGHELGILKRGHEVTPDGLSASSSGVLTFVVDDVHTTLEKLKAVKDQAEIIEPPRAMFYGQTRALVRDPAGTVVDVSSLTR